VNPAGPLTDGEFEAQAGELVRGLVTVPRDICRPFTDALLYRAVVYPFPDSVAQDCWIALATLCDAAEDQALWRWYDDVYVIGEPRGWYVPVDGGVEGYARGTQLGEPTLFSPGGRWALRIEEDGWAVVGAATELVLESFLDAVPPTDDGRGGQTVIGDGMCADWRPEPGLTGRSQVHAFLSLWSFFADSPSRSRTDWIPDLLAHLYGPEEAARLLMRWPGLGG
jgi:hypothetical protein